MFDRFDLQHQSAHPAAVFGRVLAVKVFRDRAISGENVVTECGIGGVSVSAKVMLEPITGNVMGVAVSSCFAGCH